MREMAPTWSPDGKSIAYLSDATGEYEIYVRPQGGGEARRLTTDGGVWRFAPVWSPDSTKLAFGDRKQRLRILDVASGAITDVDKGTREDLDVYRWSPDSRWLAYEKSHDTRIPGLAVYSLDRKQALPLGDGLTPDSSPVFSTRRQVPLLPERPRLQPHLQRLRVQLPLHGGDAHLRRRPHPGRAAAVPAEERRGEGEGAEEKPAADALAVAVTVAARRRPRRSPVSVVADGFVDRTVALPGVKAGSYRALAAAPDALFYINGRRRRRDDAAALRPQGEEGREGRRRRRRTTSSRATARSCCTASRTTGSWPTPRPASRPARGRSTSRASR